MAHQELSEAGLPVDLDGMVNRDVSCLECSYNLRGLSIDGQCPECGHDVDRSIYKDRLLFCDRGWVRRLRSGAG